MLRFALRYLDNILSIIAALLSIFAGQHAYQVAADRTGPTVKPVPENGVTIPKSLWDHSWSGTQVEAQDDAGRAVSFKFLILSQEYNWEQGSTFQIEHSGVRKVGTDEIEDHFQKMLPQVQGAETLIAVGTASCEGLRDEESERAKAGRRSASPGSPVAG